MSYFFSTPVDIDIVLEDLDDRSAVDVKLDKNRKEKVPLYLREAQGWQAPRAHGHQGAVYRHNWCVAPPRPAPRAPRAPPG
jgi:hypothetical protein